MNAENFVVEQIYAAVVEIYGCSGADIAASVHKTRKDYQADFTMTTFALAKELNLAPSKVADAIGQYLQAKVEQVESVDVVNGFLNITLTQAFWLNLFAGMPADKKAKPSNGSRIMIEYSSPNTNKPLHLGHIRNNLLGASVAKILEANGNDVVKVNLVNDRGIHICKSMLAWKKWGNNATPESEHKKGDKLVGDYYVLFDRKYKEEIAAMVKDGAQEGEAKQRSALMAQAQEMLRKWESGDADTIKLWKQMNGWVYEGFAKTYQTLGVEFDRTYYESQTYVLGSELVDKGLEEGVFYARGDGSVWIDLREDGLDEKLVRRSDGTSVYITQDIGTAVERFAQGNVDEHIYVVGNEQDYHFAVLRLILLKLGFGWANHLRHLSYGMVELPDGKMKSREGTVVDADDLLEQMFDAAREVADELGKLDGLSDEEKERVVRVVGLGALKYFILKVDPQRRMLFNPRESIDFNGNTGPFIQYAYARICSVLRKAQQEQMDYGAKHLDYAKVRLAGKELSLIKLLDEYDGMLKAAAKALSPALAANYAYDLAKEYNQFYHDYPILKENDKNQRMFRLSLSARIAAAIKDSLALLGIEVAQRM